MEKDEKIINFILVGFALRNTDGRFFCEESGQKYPFLAKENFYIFTTKNAAQIKADHYNRFERSEITDQKDGEKLELIPLYAKK